MRLAENYLHVHNSNFKMYVTKIIKVQMPKTEIFPFQFQITHRMYVFLLLISKAKLSTASRRTRKEATVT
jgi:hypothetical protein